MLYLAIAPLVFFVVFKRVKKIRSAIKNEDNDQLKVHILSLSLIIIVVILMVLANEFI